MAMAAALASRVDGETSRSTAVPAPVPPPIASSSGFLNRSKESFLGGRQQVQVLYMLPTNILSSTSRIGQSYFISREASTKDLKSTLNLNVGMWDYMRTPKVKKWCI
jgi:hypothetical protein